MLLPIDDNLVMRLCALDAEQNVFNLRWKYVYAANDNHIICSALDFADSRACPAAFAFFIIDTDNISCSVSYQWNSLLGKRCDN